MTTEIYQSTEKLKQKTAGTIPFEKMEINQSVFIPFDKTKEDSLRSVVSNASKRHNKIFKVVKHLEWNVYEVGCVDDTIGIGAKVEYKIMESSPEAKLQFSNGLIGKTKYPFEELKEGFSFILPIAEAKENSLRVQCCVQSKKLNRKFVLLKHEKLGIYEIACLVTKPVQFFVNSHEAIEKGESNAE